MIDMAIKLIIATIILGTIVWEQTTPQVPNLCQKRYDVQGQGIGWSCQAGIVSVRMKSAKTRAITLAVDHAATVWLYRDGVMPAKWSIHSRGSASINRERPLYILGTRDVLVVVFSTAKRYVMSAAWSQPGA